MQLYESLNIKKEDYDARKKQSLENFKFLMHLILHLLLVMNYLARTGF
jgi:hypothetical protein